MFNNNTNNISIINNSFNKKSTLNANWIQLTNVNDDFELSSQYANICQQHEQEKKWILFINPEETSIEHLANNHGIDVSKVLMVNFKISSNTEKNTDLEHVKSALSKGNCSAVILSNTNFKDEEISQLESSACEGKTQCVLLKKRALH